MSLLFRQMHDLQLRVIKHVSSEHQAELEEQKKLLSSICCDWAQEFHLRHELEKAKRHYTDALNHRPDDHQVSLSVWMWSWCSEGVFSAVFSCRSSFIWLDCAMSSRSWITVRSCVWRFCSSSRNTLQPQWSDLFNMLPLHVLCFLLLCIAWVFYGKLQVNCGVVLLLCD